MNYLDHAQTFIEAAKRATDLRDLSDLFDDSIQEMGCIHFACMSSVDPVRPPMDAIVLGQYPDGWAAHFSDQKYQVIDPVYQTAQAVMTPFRWQDPKWRSQLTRDQLDILDEAADVGLDNGVSIPIHCTNGFPASCSIVFESNKIDEQAVHALHLMAIYLHEAALRIQIAPSPFKKKCLTPRQKECLELTALGKSDWVIGQILSISENTVHFHVGLALKRLGVATRSQAVVKALFLGEIRFADISMEPTDESAPVELFH